jgi:hypothetical protein
MTKPPAKPEIWWCIKSGKILLPFTARTTRQQALGDWVGGELFPDESCVKIEIREIRRGIEEG